MTKDPENNPESNPRKQAFLRSLLACAVPLVLVMAGCGGGPSSNPSNGSLTISPATRSIDTNGQVQFTATLPNGSPATGVTWAITTGTNDNTTLGQGSVSNTGLYFPPSALSKDSVQVQVQATLASNAFNPVSAVVTVTPGFITTVTPENATVASSGTVPLTATIAELGGGSINWSLSTAPSAGSSPGSAGGSFGNTSCQNSGGINSSNPYYTVCNTTYTAPSAVPSQAIYAVGAVASNSATSSFAKLLLNSSGLNTSPLDNQAAQTSTIQLGSSGGNNNDVDTDSSGNIIDCASGTLGSLVQDQASNLYILSNNHVLADSDQGKVGIDAIIQPGLVDTGCTQLAAGVTGITQVGTLKYFVPLLYPPTVPNPPATNVDAALAATTSSSVDATGKIIALGGAGAGSPTSTTNIGSAAPVAGMGEVLTAANLTSATQSGIHVAKSGRTTGLTCSTVDTIGTTIQVSYFSDAAETQPYTTKTFTNQIGIPGSYFSDAGDSGSLVVDTANAQAVGLFFAGATATSTQPGESFAQPIGEVLTELGQLGGAPSGTTFTMVGGSPHTVNCLNYDANTATASVAVSASNLNAAKAVASQQGSALVDASKGILGVAAGKSLDQPGQAAVLVYTDQNHAGPIAVPQTMGGLPTRVIATTAGAVASGTVPTSSVTPGIHLSQATLDAAIAVQKQQTPQLMS
ncbi:MAG TPA: hypothetical protein VE218_10150, partial [Acidobacteriaceae bacterium]|nr:hypothetical protein [Acidobacteriaceae bacterium]